MNISWVMDADAATGLQARFDFGGSEIPVAIPTNSHSDLDDMMPNEEQHVENSLHFLLYKSLA